MHLRFVKDMSLSVKVALLAITSIAVVCGTLAVTYGINHPNETPRTDTHHRLTVPCSIIPPRTVLPMSVSAT